MRRRALTFSTIAVLLIVGECQPVGRPGEAPVGSERRRLLHERRCQNRAHPARQRADRGVSVEDITAVEFSPRKTPPQAAPDPAQAPSPITVPSGTVLNVLLTQAIDVDATKAGMTFKALVDDPVMLGGKVVVPRNAAVVVQVAKVEQAGNLKARTRSR